MRTAITTLMIASILLAVGCKKSTTGTGGGGGGGSATGNLRVAGFVYDGGTYVVVQDSAGNPISNAVVVVNNDTIPYFSFIGAYFDSTLVFEKGATYTLSIDAGSQGSVQASVTGPNIDSLHITSPTDGENVPLNEDLGVNWQYFGGNNDKYVSVGLFYGSEDTARYSEYDLDGSTTSHTIPGSYLNQDGTWSVIVEAYNYTQIEGARYPVGSQTPPDLGAVFGAGWSHSVSIQTGSGGGGGTWMGQLSGNVNGGPANGSWMYPSPVPLYNLGFTITFGGITEQFGTNVSSFPVNQATLQGTLGDILNITTTYQSSDSVAGTWQMSGTNSGSGTWGGRRVLSR